MHCTSQLPNSETKIQFISENQNELLSEFMQGLKHLDDSILSWTSSLPQPKGMKITESDPTILHICTYVDGDRVDTLKCKDVKSQSEFQDKIQCFIMITFCCSIVIIDTSARVSACLNNRVHHCPSIFSTRWTWHCLVCHDRAPFNGCNLVYVPLRSLL